MCFKAFGFIGLKSVDARLQGGVSAVEGGSGLYIFCRVSVAIDQTLNRVVEKVFAGAVGVQYGHGKRRVLAFVFHAA